jgi:putative membrane protein
VKARLLFGLAAITGAIVTIGLIGIHGFDAIMHAVLRSAGSAQGWVFLWARWIREAVDGLLPVAQVGGEVVGARLLALRGVGTARAAASVVVDLTVEAITQFVFTLMGVALLVLQGYDEGAVTWVVIGLAVSAPVLIGLVLAQRWGAFMALERLFEHLAEKWNWRALGKIGGLHEAVEAIYARPSAVASGAILHLASWVIASGEVWLALRAMGAPVGIQEAIILESLGQAVRSAAFVVPAALGVQEGGYLVFGGILGIGPELALALSLIKRVRELLLGLPALVAWQIAEGHVLVRALGQVRSDVLDK